MLSKSQLFILIGICAFIFFVFVISVLTGGSRQTTQPSPSPSAPSRPFPLSSPVPLDINPILTPEVPLKPQSEGGGVNLDSSLVQSSQEQISALLPALPFNTSFTAPNGKTISISIPSAQYQETPWVLDIEIFGINYQTQPGDDDYQTQRQLFLQSAVAAFDWIRSKNVDPEKIIINWGDREYIRNTAEEWLK